jgi:hypothetical protein
MNERLASRLIDLNERGTLRMYVSTVLEKFPDVVEALEKADAVLVLLPGPRTFSSDDDGDGAAHFARFVERIRQEVAAGVESMSKQKAWPIFVGEGHASDFRSGIPAGENHVRLNPLPVKPARGTLAGYVIPGEGGALFYIADGSELSSWEGARQFVLDLVRQLPSQR